MRLRAPALLLFALLGEPVTAQVQQAAAPMWSPDASRIAFASNRTGDWEIYTLDVATGDVTRVTRDGASDLFPAWSPDGRTLVFESDRDGDFDLYEVRLETGVVQRLASFDATRDGRPQFTPDGRGIYFHSMRGPRAGRFDTDLYVMSLDRPALVRLVDGVGGDSFAAWSPVDDVVLFGSNRDGPWEIFRVSGRGEAREKVVSAHGEDAANFPSFAPDGRRFVHQYVTETGSDLFLVDLADGASMNITGTPELYELHPAWSPKGDAIAFVVRTGEAEGPGTLMMIAPDGTHRREVVLRFPD